MMAALCDPGLSAAAATQPGAGSTAPPFSPLTLFESTITNAQMLLESMAERELFAAIRIVTCLHATMLQVMEPRFSRVCDRSDQLAAMEAVGIPSVHHHQQQEQQEHQRPPQLGGAKGEPGLLGAALCAIKVEGGGVGGKNENSSLLDDDTIDRGGLGDDEEDEELDEEDEECVIMADEFGGGNASMASSSAFSYRHALSSAKAPRYDFSEAASSGTRGGGSGSGSGGGDVPAECKTVMRRAYKALKGGGPHLFDFSMPFSAEVNQRVAAHVLTKAKEMSAGKGWPDDVWQRIAYKYRIDGIFSHFRTKAKSKYRDNKLSRRQRGFELVATSLSTEELEKFRVILTRDYTSSDEECGSGGTDQLRVRELPWESDEVRRLKRQLDQVYADNCATTKQRQQLAKIIRDPVRSRSQRPPPEGAPEWALKSGAPPASAKRS